MINGVERTTVLEDSAQHTEEFQKASDYAIDLYTSFVGESPVKAPAPEPTPAPAPEPEPKPTPEESPNLAPSK